MKFAGLLLVVVIAAPFLNAQNQPLEFEVASVRPNVSRLAGPVDRVLGCHGTDGHSPGTTIPLGRCIARFEPLRLVIALAYDIPPASMYPYEGQVLTGPNWINSEIYDIDAKAETPATTAQLKQMLQGLLAERFKLKIHRETRELPVYALVLKNEKSTVKLDPAPKDRECGDQRRRDHRYELGATSLSGHCHAFVPGGSQEAFLLGQSVEMADFAEMLSIWAGRVVVDKTGINGLFDIKIPAFTGQNAPIAVSAAGGERGGARIIDAPLLPTVFNMLDKLGLKLESTKGPVEIIVIDSIERPSEN
jgi:uncharacterized protein (TIGR03435 family)